MLRFRTDKSVKPKQSKRHPEAFGLQFKLSRKPIRVSAASLRGRHRHPDCAYRFASGPGPLAIGPFNRSIEEERPVQVLVRDNNVQQALKVLKKKMQREGVFREAPRPLRKALGAKSSGEGGGHPPRPQARSQKAPARGSAPDEGPRNRRPRAHSSLLIFEHPSRKQSRCRR